MKLNIDCKCRTHQMKARITYLYLWRTNVWGFDNLVQLIIWCGSNPFWCLLHIGCWPWFSFKDISWDWPDDVDVTTADILMSIRITDVIRPMIIMSQIVHWYRMSDKQNVMSAEIKSSARDKSPDLKEQRLKQNGNLKLRPWSSESNVTEGQFWYTWWYDWSIDDAALEYKKSVEINQSNHSEIRAWTIHIY